jgi:hypothetical protein
MSPAEASPATGVSAVIPGAQVGALAIESAQEQFQHAYVSAIIAAARCTSSKPEPDMDGIDLHVRQEIAFGSTPYESALDLQLKSTMQSDAVDSFHVSLKLKKAHYDRLRTPNVTVPRILVVTTLPANVAEWHEQSEECLRLLRCSYWMSLKGFPAIDTASKTIKVPRKNVFSVEALCDLMYRVRANLKLDLGA